METIKNLLELLMQNLQNLYSAEDQVERAIPVIIEQANHSSLKNALSHHAGLTALQKERLQKMYEVLQKKREKTYAANSETLLAASENKGIAGLIDEANQMLAKNLAREVKDAAIIAAVQLLEHYEISAYGTALAYAGQLHLETVVKLLNETLQEEYDANNLLTELATAAINKEALPEDYGSKHSDKNVDKSSGTEKSGEGERNEKVSISERTVNSPGGRAGISHRGYGSGESRGH